MAVTKEKVIDINTSQAQKNVENLTKSFVPLRTQIKQLKDQLSQLEEGSVEYNRIAKELADTQQRQVEITEAAKYSNKRFCEIFYVFLGLTSIYVDNFLFCNCHIEIYSFSLRIETKKKRISIEILFFFFVGYI